MNIDINFYKNYEDLKNMTNNQLLKHWIKYGIKEKRLPSKKIFYNKYPNFNWRIYVNNYPDLKLLIENEVQAILHYWQLGISENREYSEILDNYESIFSKKRIYQVYVSESLNHFKDRLMKKYDLCDYLSNTKPCLFFGIYNLDDLYKILKHNGDVYIMFGGSDIDYLIKTKQINEIKKINPKQIYSISDNINKRLDELNLENTKIEFNLVDTNIFRKVSKTGNSIYIYNGFTKGNEDKYGEETYKKVVELLPEFDFIYSNELNVENSKMPEIYQKCFIGLRLTDNDGNANTVQELREMGIPVIHNGEQGGIIWNNLDDIIRIIKDQYKIKKFKEYMYDYSNKKENNINCYYQENITNDNLDIIYDNISINSDFIKKFKNILLISSDYPGYGGAATNCHKLANFLSKTNNVQEMYYVFDDENIKIENINLNLNIVFEKDLIIYY